MNIPNLVFCFSPKMVMKENNTCENITLGNQISFEIQLEATKCPKQRSHRIFIGPADLKEELILNVDIICDCECEKSSSPVSCFSLPLLYVQSALPAQNFCGSFSQSLAGVSMALTRCVPQHKLTALFLAIGS